MVRGGGGDQSGRRAGASGVCWPGGLLCTSPGSLLLSSTSPLFMPLPLGCQIWLTQSVVSLLRLALGPKPSALHHRSSPCTRRGEGGTEGQGTSGQPSTFFPVFLLTHLASDPGVRDFWEWPSRARRQDKGSNLGKIPGPGAGGQAMLLSPWLDGAREAGSLPSGPQSVIASPSV